jgi:hypothetical protein
MEGIEGVSELGNQGVNAIQFKAINQLINQSI